MFYNDKIKAEYLLNGIPSSYGENMIKLCRQFMTYVSKYERMLDKDVGEFDRISLESSAYRIAKATKKDYDLLITLVKQYVRWRKEMGLTYNKEILDIVTETERLFMNQHLKSPAHFKNVMKERTVLNDKNQQVTVGLRESGTNTIDVTYRAFLWMLYVGLTKEEAIDVRASDVDLKNRCIVYNGRTFELPVESIEDFEKACNLTTFTFEKPSTSEPIFFKRKDGDLILRGYKSGKPTLTTLTPAIQRKLCPPDVPNLVKPSYPAIAKSGVFFRTYVKELLGYPPDFTEDAIRMADKTKHTTEEARQTAIKRFLKIYLSEYTTWRDLFYVK